MGRGFVGQVGRLSAAVGQTFVRFATRLGGVCPMVVYRLLVLKRRAGRSERVVSELRARPGDPLGMSPLEYIISHVSARVVVVAGSSEG